MKKCPCSKVLMFGLFVLPFLATSSLQGFTGNQSGHSSEVNQETGVDQSIVNGNNHNCHKGKKRSASGSSYVFLSTHANDNTTCGEGIGIGGFVVNPDKQFLFNQNNSVDSDIIHKRIKPNSNQNDPSNHGSSFNGTTLVKIRDTGFYRVSFGASFSLVGTNLLGNIIGLVKNYSVNASGSLVGELISNATTGAYTSTSGITYKASSSGIFFFNAGDTISMVNVSGGGGGPISLDSPILSGSQFINTPCKGGSVAPVTAYLEIESLF